jgi:long-chain acyl-CoA synthetase
MKQPRLSSIDQPWLKYYSEEAVNAGIPKCTVFENILRHNESHLNEHASNPVLKLDMTQ